MLENNSVSIIIPTFHEVLNVPQLVNRIAQVELKDHEFEVILVDDNSQDGIEEVVDKLWVNYPWLKLLIRKGRRGLSASVIDGIKVSRFQYVIVMDADLSHPPEVIPLLLQRLIDENLDFVIGSRYIYQGSIDDNWNIQRRITSRLSAFIARLLISNKAKDPLSGFFAVKKSGLHLDKLDPIGWKIGLEMITKCNFRNIQEVPIHFQERQAGKSKLSLKLIFIHVLHFIRLIRYKLFIA